MSVKREARGCNVAERSSQAEHLFGHWNVGTGLVDIQELSLVSILFSVVQVDSCLGDLGLWDLVGDAPSDVVLIRGMLFGRGQGMDCVIRFVTTFNLVYSLLRKTLGLAPLGIPGRPLTWSCKMKRSENSAKGIMVTTRPGASSVPRWSVLLCQNRRTWPLTYPTLLLGD